MGVPLAPESVSALHLQRAMLSDAVVLENYQGIAHTVSSPDKARAEGDQLCTRQGAGDEQ
jgi:hypothetical protein